MKVYFMLSRNNFVAIICAVVLVLMLCGLLKTALIPEVKDGATNESRINYILSLGYKVAETPVTSKETVVPESYGEAYEEYLSLQTDAGFPLEDYKGQTAWLYEYRDKTGTTVTLVVAQGKIIGGHISDGEGKELKPLQIKG